MADKMTTMLHDVAIKYSGSYKKTLLKNIFNFFGERADSIGVVIHHTIKEMKRLRSCRKLDIKCVWLLMVSGCLNNHCNKFEHKATRGHWVSQVLQKGNVHCRTITVTACEKL